MKKLLLSLVCCGLLVAGIVYLYPWLAVGAGLSPSDKALVERVESNLDRDFTLRDQDVRVDIDHGVATLTGTVASEENRAQAGKLAKVDGVATVNNRIVVGPAETSFASAAGDQVKSSFSQGAEAAKHGLEKAGAALAHAGSEVTDAWIISDIHAHFVGEDLLKASEINVDCDQRVVTLRGTVPTSAGRHRAMVIARRTNGVTRVVDRLEIGPKK